MALLAQRRETWRQTGDWRHRRKSGQLIDVELVSHTLTFEGRPAVLVVSQDVTERKRLEAQFLQAQKMDAIGQLAGGVAHDFNNILTGILAYCDLIVADREPNDPVRPDVEEIRKAAVSAASLTSGLLAFSRKQIIEPKFVALNTVVSDTGRMLERLVGEDIQIELHLEGDLWPLHADPGQLGQVLMNLVVNARDAMPRGGQLTIETENVVLDQQYVGTHFAVVPGSYVMLAVSDTGVGMSSEVQARLFEPFFTTKEVGRGTGWGLASVYGIVKQHKGNIWVYSEVGQGTTFKIYLPRAEASAMKTQPVAATAPVTNTATILVVEDNPSLGKVIHRILRRYGFTVLFAGTADEARRLVAEHPEPIDVLLSDVVMPQQSGPALAAELSPRRPEMRVIHMSGYTDDAVVRHGMLDRKAVFLQKPFTADVLVRKLREVLATPRT
jgi:two-component system cell cycle sensor histidine kinase/response regulator CckA